MRSWTAHLRPGGPPVLVKDGFSWGGLFFGGLWLLWHRAWIPGAIVLAATVAMSALPFRFGMPLQLGLAVVVGLLGRDMVRWSLERRGYVMAHVLAARDEEGAYGRLLTFRPDLASNLVPTLAADLAVRR